MSVESRLTIVEESLKNLRDANRLQGRRFSAAAPSQGAVPRWNAITKKWEPVDLSAALTDEFWLYTDFFRTAADDADPYFHQFTSGTGAAFANVTATASHQGVWSLATGTTTTGHAALNTYVDGLIFSNGRIRCGAWIRTPDNISDATNRYEIYMGIIDTTAPSAAQEAIFLHYRDNINSGNWEADVENGGSGTVADTGITVATSTWYYLEIEINAAGDNVQFFIDGVLKVTTASGPASSGTAEVRIGILKSAGTTSRRFNLDTAYLAGDLATAR
jgi:hypothetical protein